MRKVPLTQGKNVLVDDEDYENITQYKWHISNNGYAMRTIRVARNKRKPLFLHHFIIPVLENQYIDHKDLDKLNCQKNNLRIATKSDNNVNKKPYKNNTTGYKGVYWNKEWRKYMATIQKDRKQYFLGYYKTAAEAAFAYNQAAKKYHGEFAWLNHIDSAVPLLA